MYLLNTSTFQLHRFIGDKVPRYAILSHTWGDGEVLFQDIEKPASHYEKLKGFSKVDKCCALARSDGWEYIWIDNCCIDQKSSAELSEAINSMYRWYKDAKVCYAYLADISVSVRSTESPRKKLCESRWFTRGWTLQELLAPEFVIFYDRDWIDVGTKHSLRRSLSDATGIGTDHLFKPRSASAAARMSWASSRETTRPEDIAYCLLGLFGVNMPLLYGEGATKAFKRLQHEIIRSEDDESIFAWLSRYGELGQPLCGDMLAPSPEHFSRSGNIVRIELPNLPGPRVTLGSFGISMRLSFTAMPKQSDRELEFQKAGRHYHRTDDFFIAPLACTNKERKSSPLKLHLLQFMPGKIARLHPKEFDYIAKESLGQLDIRTFHVNYRLHNKGLSLFKCFPAYSSTFTVRLSLGAQGRLSFRGADDGKDGLLSTSTVDDGKLTVIAAKSSMVSFQHAREFMVIFSSARVPQFVLHIDRELLYARDAQSISVGIGECISVPLDDKEVLWVSSKYGCDSIGKLPIVDVDISSKDKVDRESIL